MLGRIMTFFLISYFASILFSFKASCFCFAACFRCAMTPITQSKVPIGKELQSRNYYTSSNSNSRLPFHRNTVLRNDRLAFVSSIQYSNSKLRERLRGSAIGDLLEAIYIYKARENFNTLDSSIEIMSKLSYRRQTNKVSTMLKYILYNKNNHQSNNFKTYGNKRSEAVLTLALRKMIDNALFASMYLTLASKRIAANVAREFV